MAQLRGRRRWGPRAPRQTTLGPLAVMPSSRNASLAIQGQRVRRVRHAPSAQRRPSCRGCLPIRPRAGAGLRLPQVKRDCRDIALGV